MKGVFVVLAVSLSVSLALPVFQSPDKSINVRDEFVQIRAILGNTANDIQNLVRETSDETREKVRTIFDNSRDALNVIGERIELDLNNGHLKMQTTFLNLNSGRKVLIETVVELKEALLKHPELHEAIRTVVDAAKKDLEFRLGNIQSSIIGIDIESIQNEEIEDGQELDEIQLQIVEIQAIVEAGIEEIKEIALGHSVEAKQQIEAVIEVGRYLVKDVLKKMHVDFSNRRMTNAKLLQYFVQIVKIARAIQHDMNLALNNFPEIAPAVLAKIQAIQAEVEIHIQLIRNIISEAQELIDALNSIKGDAIRAEIQIIKATVMATGQEIRKMSVETNSDVREIIEAIVDSARYLLEDIEKKIKTGLGNADLNGTMLVSYIRDIRKVVAATTHDLKEQLMNYHELSIQIQEVIVNAKAKVQTSVQNIGNIVRNQ